MDPPLLQPKCTEAYYTSTVLHREECRHTEIPRADGPPLLIEPTCTEPYYTMTVLPMTACRPLLIEPTCTETYYTRTVYAD